MKGIMIYEAPFWGDEENAVYTHEVTNASYTLEQVGCTDITCHLEGTATKDPITKAKCSKDDTYDFETGALISLMKRCGLEKSAKAYAEIFDDTAYGDALIERDKLKEENKSLKASVCAKRVINARLLKDCNSAQSAYEIMVEKSADLMDTIKKLEERINELEAYNNQLEDRVAAEQRGGYKFLKDMEKLEAENNKLKDEVRIKKDAINEMEQILSGTNYKIGDLVRENEKLKLDCEKLQHGYNDMIFCGGRQNGKQYTLLVDLFKKIDQKKVDAAYKEAYHTTLPAWQKEFLNSLYGFHKESKEKTELPRILDINGTVYRKSIQIKDFGEEITKLSSEAMSSANLFTISKREKMWDDILKEGRTPIWVKREDIHDFLEECQAVGIKWSSGKLPLETMPFGMIDEHDGAYFFVMTSIDISKSKPGVMVLRHVMTWWTTACPEEVEGAIHYIRPMRWDLFEKGRIAVKVSKENYSEFCGKILSHFTKVRISSFNHSCKYGYFVFNKDTDYVDRIFVSDNGDVKEINGHKVVDWEDVR